MGKILAKASALRIDINPEQSTIVPHQPLRCRPRHKGQVLYTALCTMTYGLPECTNFLVERPRQRQYATFALVVV
jgi:hypothetical protein